MPHRCSPMLKPAPAASDGMAVSAHRIERRAPRAENPQLAARHRARRRRHAAAHAVARRDTRGGSQLSWRSTPAAGDPALTRQGECPGMSRIARPSPSIVMSSSPRAARRPASNAAAWPRFSGRRNCGTAASGPWRRRFRRRCRRCCHRRPHDPKRAAVRRARRSPTRGAVRCCRPQTGMTRELRCHRARENTMQKNPAEAREKIREAPCNRARMASICGA